MKGRILILAAVLLGLLALGLTACEEAEEEDETATKADTALLTAAVLMAERHERSTKEALDVGDSEEAKEEAEEIINYLTANLPLLPAALADAVTAAIDAFESVHERLEAGDLEGAKAVFSEVEESVSDFHHEMHEHVGGAHP